MSFETERLIHENAPTPDQLRRLASIGMRSAVSRGRLRTITPKARPRPLHYFIDEFNYMASPTESDFLQVRHRMTASVAAKPVETGEKRRTLALFDVYFVENEEGVETGVKAVYKFEWSRRQTLMAQKSLYLLGMGESNGIGLDEYLDRFRVDDDAAAILSVDDDIRHVTAEDCADLAESMNDYFTVIEAVNRAEAA